MATVKILKPIDDGYDDETRLLNTEPIYERTFEEETTPPIDIDGLNLHECLVYILIPKTTSVKRILFAPNTKDARNGYLGDTNTNYPTKIYAYYNHKKNLGHIKVYSVRNSTWLGTYGITIPDHGYVPEKITSFRFGLGDSYNELNLPAGTVVKIYGR